jgi:predicted ATPase
MVQAITSEAPTPADVEQAILRHAEGNPLLLEELTLTIVEQGGLHHTAAIPPTIHAVLASRIDRLPPPVKRLLQAASVIGKDAPVSLLTAIAGMSDEGLERCLAHLQATEFLYETTHLADRTLTFKHTLTREAAYQSLLHSTRQQYHQQIAHILAECFPETVETQPELLAYHYTEAGLGAHAIRYWYRAGQRAAERPAHREAIEHLTNGLKMLSSLPDTSEPTQHELALQIALGRSFMAMKGYGAPEVGQAYVRARVLCEQLGAPLQLFSVLRGLWVFHYMWAEFQTAQELGEQCLRLAQHMQDADLLLRAHHTLGTTLYFCGEFVRARTHLEEGIAHYAAVQRPRRIIRAVQDPGVTCVALLGLQLWYLGYPDRALQQGTEAIALAEDLAHPFSQAEALFFAGVVHILRREVQAAQERLAAVLTLSREQGFPRWGILSTVLCGWTLAAQGQGSEGIGQIRRGLEAWRATSGEAAGPWLLSLLAEAYRLTGDIGQGLAVVTEALALVKRAGEGQPEAELCRLKGELLLARSMADRADAEACFHEALTIARRQQAKSLELRAAVSLARLWRCQSKRPEAYQLLEAAYNWFTEGHDTTDLRGAKALLDQLAGGA